MGFAPGTRLDRYVVEGVLGQGGMAIVYKVRHAQLGTLHALKVLNTPNPQVRDRMLREGRVQGAMRHPNLVPVTDLVEISGSPGLVMEYVDGPTLESLLERYRPTLAQADAIATAILEGVAYAHRKGFIHRDLKPANVLLANSAGGLVPKVADFGLAKLVGADEQDGMHHTRSGVVMGTPSYMAPEQIRDSKHVDQRADVFSLGVMLYELLSGRKPFVGDDIVQLYTAITTGTYKPIHALVPNIPGRMERAITAALVVDRNGRIQDCDRLLAIWRGDESSRRSSTPGEIARNATNDTAVPALPEPFFPEASGDAEKEITFHDVGTAVPGVPTTRDHWLLNDLSKIKIAAPDIGAIDPTSDVPAEPRLVIPVEPGGPLPTLDSDLADEAGLNRTPWGAVVVVLAGIVLIAALGTAFALGAFSPAPAPAQTPPPSDTPAAPAPEAPAPKPPPKPKPRPKPAPPAAPAPAAPAPTAPAPVEPAPIEVPPTELPVEDVGVTPEGAPSVDTPPPDR